MEDGHELQPSNQGLGKLSAPYMSFSQQEKKLEGKPEKEEVIDVP